MIEQYDILTIQDKEYTVAEQLMLDNNEYLLLIEVDKDENTLKNQMIVEKVKIEDGYGIKNIDDKNIYKKVKHQLINMLYNE